jgi:hypothetical protein
MLNENGGDNLIAIFFCNYIVLQGDTNYTDYTNY